MGKLKMFNHATIERNATILLVLGFITVAIGGIVEIAPLFYLQNTIEKVDGMRPYTPLELAGRNIYIREGCYVCHSQMIRPMRAELQRYGEWTRAGELVYERPFLLGSRRIGPDLQRVGGKYPDAWHYEHMRDPRSTSPGSIMPPYAFLLERRIDPRDVTASVVALRRLGVPYDNATVEQVARHMNAQAAYITRSLAAAQIDTEPDREIIALIAYLQRLGQDGRRALEAAEAATAAAPAPTPAKGTTAAPAPTAEGGS
jgi:cbb3-type cytochrome c oxidase subunit II